MPIIHTPAALKHLLQHTRTIAVVGISTNTSRASHFVSVYMQAHGYTIIPVNPAYTEVLGQPCYPSLQDIPVPVDMVNVFRRPEEVPAIVTAACTIGARSLWLQLGVTAPEAAAAASAAGLTVVMDRCLKIDHARLFSSTQPH